MKKRRYPDFARGQTIGTVIIIILMLVLLGAVSWWMYDVGLLLLPDSIERLLGIDDDGGSEISWDLGELSEIVRDERHPDVESVSFEMTLENLHAAFLAEASAPGLYLSGRVSYYDDGEAIPHRVVFRRSGSDFRAEIYKNDNLYQLDTLKIGTGTTVYIRDGGTGSFRSLPLDETFLPEYEAGIPSVAEIIEAVRAIAAPEIEPESEPSADTEAADETTAVTTAAEESPYADCELKLVRRPEGSVYYVKFTYADLGIREEYYVSLDHGIVLSATTTRQGQPVYSYEALSFSADPSSWQDAQYYSVANPK